MDELPELRRSFLDLSIEDTDVIFDIDLATDEENTKLLENAVVCRVEVVKENLELINRDVLNVMWM